VGVRYNQEGESEVSIDRYYVQAEGVWKRLDEADFSKFHAEFWVDLCHAANVMVDERYFFADMGSAIEFYLEGWKQRQFLDDDDQACGLDHHGLYSRGKLIHGQSVHGDVPGHEGERLRELLKAYTRPDEEGAEL
jgi:hypothetical protein